MHPHQFQAALRAAAGLAIALAGCSLPTVKAEHLDDISEADAARADALPEVRAEAAARAEPLGAVEGVSCRRAYKGAPPSWEDAIRRAKYRALKLGADAVADLDCARPESKSLRTLCLESIRCTATAVRVAR